MKASEGSERLVIVLNSLPESIPIRICPQKRFKSGTAGNSEAVDCQTRAAVYAFSPFLSQIDRPLARSPQFEPRVKSFSPLLAREAKDLGGGGGECFVQLSDNYSPRPKRDDGDSDCIE